MRDTTSYDTKKSRPFLFYSHVYFPASGQAVATGVVPSSPRFLASIFIAHRVQQSHCSSIVHRVLLTHACALSASQFVRKKKSPRIYTSTHSRGFEITKLTYYTRLEDNLIRHRRGDRLALLACRGDLLGGKLFAIAVQGSLSGSWWVKVRRINVDPTQPLTLTIT